MGIDDLVKKAKDMAGDAADFVKDKGGDLVDNIKEDAAEIKDIAQGEGSLSDKAKAALDAVKEHDGKPGEGGAAE